MLLLLYVGGFALVYIVGEERNEAEEEEEVEEEDKKREETLLLFTHPPTHPPSLSSLSNRSSKTIAHALSVSPLPSPYKKQGREKKRSSFSPPPPPKSLLTHSPPARASCWVWWLCACGTLCGGTLLLESNAFFWVFSSSLSFSLPRLARWVGGWWMDMIISSRYPRKKGKASLSLNIFPYNT